MEDVIKSESILSCWEAIAHFIQTKCEAYSVELLLVITDLWITICAFAKEWTLKFVSKYRKGTRKDIETEMVAYINNVTVACNIGLFVCIMLFLDVLKVSVILYVIYYFVHLLIYYIRV